MRVLVTGGRGGLGRDVVRRLQTDGHDVLIGTRHPSKGDEVQFDLDGTVPELVGVDTLVHLASDATNLGVEVSGATELFEEARRSGVGHVIYMSIVGIDRHPFPYYRAKLGVEEALMSSGVPWTIFRSTQFHSFIPRLVDRLGRFGVVPVPTGIGVQPIDRETVADRLVEIVEAGPAGRVPDLGGPEVLALIGMARDYAKVSGRRTLVVPIPTGGKLVAAFRRGEHHTANRDHEGRTYRQYLDSLDGRRDQVAGLLRLCGLALAFTAVVMVVAPRFFYERVAGFGELNIHFIRDTATFVVPLAVALWMAADRPGWRRPVLALGLVQNGFHLVNHTIDLGNAEPFWQGPANLAALLVLQLVLWAGWRATRRDSSNAVRTKVSV